MQADTRPQYLAKDFKWPTFIGIAIIHVGALAALFPYFFSWPGLILCVVLMWATASLGVSLCYHRLLSHKSWQAVPALRNALVFLACLALQDGPILWSATHRMHHRESDHEDDPHSPLVNFFWSHMGWLFFRNHKLEDPAVIRRLAPDLVGDKTLRWFDRWFFWMWIWSGIVIFSVGFFAGGMGMTGLHLGLSLFVWGFLLRTVWVWHNTWFVNSVTHLFGYRNYNTEDESRNLWWVAFTTYGEGWHNNHHAAAGSAKFGQKWWEFDPTWWALVVFKQLGWVRKVTVGKYIAPVDGRLPEAPGKAGSTSARLLRNNERSAIRLAEKYRHAPDVLAEELSSRRRHTRVTAALALSYLGEGAKGAVAPLISALKDQSEHVREAAIQALVKIGDAAVPALQRATQEAQDTIQRMASQRALAQIRVVE